MIMKLIQPVRHSQLSGWKKPRLSNNRLKTSRRHQRTGKKITAAQSKPSFLARVFQCRDHSEQQRRALYIKVLSLSLGLIWAIIGLVIYLTPVSYTSEWTLILPGAGSGHAVNLDSIGQASATTASPFTNTSIDPSMNYKAIADSRPVLFRAADALGLSIAEFGRAKIKLVDQTALMHFKISASNPELAQNKAISLYEALQFQLERLRDDEQNRVTQASLATLNRFGEKLELTQQQKLNFQTASGIISIGQFEQLVSRLESERVEIGRLDGQLQALSAKKSMIQNSLNLTHKQVYQAVNLRNDELFQNYLQRHAEVHTQIATIAGTWGNNHPKLQQLQSAHHSVEHALEQRGHKLVNDSTLTIWTLIEIGSSQFENPLFEQLIQLNAEIAGLEEQLNITREQFALLKSRIEASAENALKIEDLNRKQQVALAVFSTALAKQDIGKTDRFASFPLVQILSNASLPEAPDSLALKLAVTAGIFASGFTLFGLGLLWMRKSWLQ